MVSTGIDPPIWLSQSYYLRPKTEFVNVLCDRMFEVMKINKKVITAYRPTANGMVERLNYTLKAAIKKYAEFDKIKLWDIWLPFIAFSYNNTVHSATKFTPFYLMHGREARIPIDVMRTHDESNVQLTVSQYAARLHHTLQTFRHLARENLERRELVKTWFEPFAVTTVENPRYQVGDLVWITTNNPVAPRHDSHTMERSVSIGPYQVTRQVSDIAFEVDREGRPDVVHVDRLLPYTAPEHLPSSPFAVSTYRPPTTVWRNLPLTQPVNSRWRPSWIDESRGPAIGWHPSLWST